MERNKEDLVECPDCKDSRGYFQYDDDPCPLCEDTGLVVKGTKGWAESLMFGDKKSKLK